MKRKPNIAIVFDALTEQFMGVLVSTIRFADKLREKGYKIVFLAAKYPRRPKIDYFKGYKVYRFRSIMLPYSEKKFFVAFPGKNEISRIFKREKIDILHLMTPSPTAIAAVYAAKELKIKIFAHSHTQPENITHNFPKFLQRDMMHELFYMYLLWIYKKAEVVICPSRFAEKLLKRSCPGLKTIVLSNGVETSIFKKVSPASFMKKHNLLKGKKRLLFVGRLHPEKNLTLLLNAMPIILKKMKNVEVCIVGVGYQEKELKALAKMLGIEKSTRFLGRVKDRDLPAAYNSSDIFVLPSLVELEGMVVLEAMACGKPILIANSPTSASRDFVLGNGMKFNPRSSKDLAKKALEMLGDPGRLNEMGKESIKASRLYDLNKSVQTLDEVYESVYNGRKVS